MPSIDASSALRLVSTFFPREWAQADTSNIHIKELINGFMNTLQLLSRSTPAVHEPSAILIRHFGRSGEIEEPPERTVTLSATQQAIVYWEMSRRGWGPKVYGFFPGGRLEEYIDSHTLTAEESMQPAIRRDLARSYARFHSLNLPLRKDGFEAMTREYRKSIQTKHPKVLNTLLAMDDPRAKAYASIFQKTDWVHELEWIASLLERHGCKTTLTHGDANYLNILIRNNQTQASEEPRTLLVDYETASYSYRGFDLGGHFAERTYCYNQPDTQLSGHEAPEIEEQRAFCSEYLEELRRLGVEGSDGETVEQIVLEARIGRLGHVLVTNLMCTVYDEVEVEPMFLEGLGHMMEGYGRLKRELVEDLARASSRWDAMIDGRSR